MKLRKYILLDCNSVLVCKWDKISASSEIADKLSFSHWVALLWAKQIKVYSFVLLIRDRIPTEC